MGITDIFGGIYTKIEDMFYGLMDGLEDRGLPVYSVIDPLEEHGVPAFPLTIFLLFVFGFLLFGVVLAPTPETTVQLHAIDSSTRTALNQLTLEVTDESDKVIKLESNLFASGQPVPLKGVAVGQKLTFRFSKQGYADTVQTITLGPKANTLSVELARDVKIIGGLVKLVDAKTFDEVSNAEITATLSDNQSVLCSYDSTKRAFFCPGITEGEQASLLIKSANFEDTSFPTKFYEESVITVELEPKGSASVGDSSLIVRVFDTQTKQPIAGAQLKIFDDTDGQLIGEFSAFEGDLLTRIPKGTSIRIVVNAEGYVLYDSVEEAIERTLRNDEEIWDVPLRIGGATVTVLVNDAGGLPQSFANVQLFNESMERIGGKDTELGGEVFFTDLDVEKTFTVTAYKEGFLPAKKTFLPGNETDIVLSLEPVTQANSSRLEIFVTEEGGVGANNAVLELFELLDGVKVPFGLPQQKTDIGGKFSTYARNGSTLLVNAFTDDAEGEGQIEITPNQNNDLLIELFRTKGLVTLRLVGPDGKPATAGHVKIESIEGDTIDEFDIESLEEGEEILFDAREFEFVKVTFTDLEGKTFSEEINVKNKTEVSLTVTTSESSTGVFPQVTFKGVTTLSGDSVDGVTKNDSFYLVFEAVFPEGSGTHGFHVRVGDDTVKHADSDEVGITGFSASAQSHFYGRTFSALPAPGAEGIDFANAGKAGNSNKFLELYFGDGGTKTIKVKVKAKESTNEPNFDVHFRAWSQYGSDYYREPQDSSLNLASFSGEKSGLYALAIDETVKIFESQTGCKKSVCVSYKFLEETGAEFELKDFHPVKEKNYAVLVEISPSKDLEAEVRASTSKTAPKIFFQGYAVESATIFPDNNRLDTTLEVKGVTGAAGSAVRLLLFFRAAQTGSVQATVQTITAVETVTDNLLFEVFEEKEMAVTTKPSEVVLGENFSFEVKEKDGGAGIENAMIVLKDEEGQHLETLVGNGSTDKGANGLYVVKNSFASGIIRYEVSAQGFRPLTGELRVLLKDVLQLPEEIVVVIPKNPPTATKKVDLFNNSPELVQDVSIEIKRKANFPPGLSVRATILGLIEPNASQPITINAEYSGREQSVHAEADMIITGRLNAKFFTRTQSKIILDFNPALPQDCIEFSKGHLAVFVESGIDNRNSYNDLYNQQYYNPGLQAYDYAQIPQNNAFGLTDEQGYGVSRYQSPYNRFFGSTNTKQLDFTIRNKCDVEIELFPDVVPRFLGDNEGINVQVNSVKLKPAGTVQSGRRLDEQRVQISVTNSMLRNYPQVKTFAFDIFFNSDQVSRSVPLDVIIWNPQFSLEFPRQLELWLAQDNPSTPARAVSPIFVRNVGQAPIQNINFRVGTLGTGGSINLRILPAFPIQLLAPGQSVIPPKTVTAESTRTEKSTPNEVKRIDVSGLIDGRLHEFGSIFVTTHVSGIECLKATPNNLEFFSESTAGVLTRSMRVKNTCAESVRISGVSPNEFGSNRVDAVIAEQTILPGQEKEVQLILSKKESWQVQVPVFVDGLLFPSQKPIRSNPVNLDLRIGKEAFQPQIAFEQKQVPVCGTDEVRTVKFPKIAKTQNCETAYCDAEQLAQYIVKKGAEKLQQARREVANYKSDIENTACAQNELSQGYCSFDNLNVRQESFTVFFSHDNLTPELLKRSAERNAKELSAFNYDFLIGPNAGSQIGQIGKRFLLNGNVAGCGKYVVQIKGALRVVGTRIDPELVNILVDLYPEAGSDGQVAGATVEPPNAGNEDGTIDLGQNSTGNSQSNSSEISELTEQCLPKIQNFANFLPKDADSKIIGESSNAWPAVVQPEHADLEQQAKDLAKKMLESDKRGEKTSESTNKLLLEFGTQDDYLVKIEMDKTNENGPRTLSAQVQDTRGLAQNVKTEILREAIDAIAGFHNNQIDGCISPNDDYVLLKSAGSLRGLELSASACVDDATKQDNRLSVMIGQENCCTMTISSPVRERINVQALFPSRAGTTEPVIKQEGAVVTEIQLNENSAATTGNLSSNAQDAFNLPRATAAVVANLQAGTPPAQPPQGTPAQTTPQPPNAPVQNPPANNQPGQANQQANPNGPFEPSTQTPLGTQTTTSTNNSGNANAQTKKFAAQIQVCLSGQQDAQVAHGRDIEVSAVSVANSDRKTQQKQVSLQFCGVRPEKVLSKISEITQPGEYYFTPVWEGKQDIITEKELTAQLDLNAHLAEAKQTVEGRNFGTQTVVQAHKRDARLKSLGMYLASCAGVAGLYGGLLKWGFGGITDIVWDCGVPTLAAATDLFDSTRAAKKWMLDLLKEIPVIGRGVSWVADVLGNSADNLDKKLQPEYDPQETDIGTIGVGALSSVGTYSIIRGINDASTTINASTIKQAAEKISEELSEKIIHDNFSKAPAAKKDALKAALKNAIKTEIPSTMLKYDGKPKAEFLEKGVNEAIANIGKDATVIEKLVDISPDFTDRVQKEAFKKANEDFVHKLVDIDRLKSSAAESGLAGEYELILSGTTYDPTDYTDRLKKIAKDLTERTFPEVEFEIKEKLGKEFASVKIRGRDVFDKMKEDYQTRLEHNLRGIIDTKKFRPVERVAGGGLDKIVMNVSEAELKNASKVSLKSVLEEASFGFEKEIGDFAKKKISKDVASQLGAHAHELITEEGKKAGLNWPKFKSFLKSFATKAFWKDMLKGGAGGLLSNAVGLYFYKASLEKFDTPLAADVKIEKGGPTQTPDGRVLPAKDFELTRFKTYKVLVDKEGRKHQPVTVDPANVPSSAKWLNECSSAVLAGYNGLPNLVPTSAHFRKFKDQENYYAAIGYLEQYGRMLKGLEVEKTYNVPEALVITAGIMHSRLGYDSKDWITGCEPNSPFAKNATDSLACAARKLGAYYNFNDCTALEPDTRQRAICALKKYNDDPRNKKITNPNYDKLGNIFIAWNDPAIVRAS